jgi:aryl-alcohol dehydrogenase-like predicted oxidoreductase
MPDPEQTPAQKLIGDFLPKMLSLTDETLFGDIWERPELSPRDRSLITIAALITKRQHRTAQRPPRPRPRERPDRRGAQRGHRARRLLRRLAAGDVRYRRRQDRPEQLTPLHPVLKENLMQTRYLGKTGVSVSNLCLGAMMFGDWGTKDHDESIRIIHRALDARINFIDTADVYSGGESEVIVGQALADGKRDDVFLATKVGFPMGDDLHQRGASRRRIIRGVEDSLRRLNTDWIDLYQIHRPDPNTDIDETLAALTDLVRQGKIRYFGHSTFAASQIVQAQWTARDRGHLPFRCEQPPYSILTRNVEHDVLPTCEQYGMGVIPYSPLAGGWLSGRYRKDTDAQGPTSAARPQARFDMSDPANQRKLDAADALAQLAEQAGLTLIELALAFVIRHPAVTAAIIGPRTMDHLESQLAAADVQLSDDVLDRIDEIVAPGTTINVADNGWTQPSLQPALRRR